VPACAHASRYLGGYIHLASKNGLQQALLIIKKEKWSF
jgi:hypothetical protein